MLKQRNDHSEQDNKRIRIVDVEEKLFSFICTRKELEIDFSSKVRQLISRGVVIDKSRLRSQEEMHWRHWFEIYTNFIVEVFGIQEGIFCILR